MIASYQSVAGSTAVFVGISSDVVIDDFTTLSNWLLSGVRVNLSESRFQTDNSLFISSPSSGKLEYSLEMGGTSALYLNCSFPISGSPEAIGIYVCGDGKGHWLRSELNDVDGEKFLLNFKMMAGTHSVDFNASHLSSGIYLYKIDAGDFQATKKMLVIK